MANTTTTTRKQGITTQPHHCKVVREICEYYSNHTAHPMTIAHFNIDMSIWC